MLNNEGWPAGRRDANCAVWDSYLGTCREMYAPEWWEYVNVFSVAAVVLVIGCVVLALIVAAKDRRDV